MSLIKIKSILDLKSKLLDKSWLSIVIYLARVFKISNYVLKYLSFFYLKRKLIYILYIWTKLLSCSFFLLLFQVVSIVKKSNDLLRMWICLLITKSYKKPIVTLLGEKVRNFIFFCPFRLLTMLVCVGQLRLFRYWQQTWTWSKVHTL